MTETLILLSHPNFAKSQSNRRLADAAATIPGVEIVHLEGRYPDSRIDLDAEVTRMLAARRYVLQFPIHWYSTPPLLKAWQDSVLTRMFYINAKTEGDLIAGRRFMLAATSGNRPSAYTPEGINLFPLEELLKPLHSTANRCGLRWCDPFITYENSRPPEEKLTADAERYREHLQRFIAGDPPPA